MLGNVERSLGAVKKVKANKEDDNVRVISKNKKHKKIANAREEIAIATRENIDVVEGESVLKKSKVVSPTSVDDFFNGIAMTNRRPTVDEAFGISPRFPCKGRDDQLDKILRSIGRGWSPGQKQPVHYFHASSGVGKTYLLMQLFLKQFPRQYSDLIDNTFFLVADFNRGSCREAELLKDHFRTNPELFILLRIFYLEFVDQQQLWWNYFLRFFFDRFSSDELKEDARKYITRKIKERVAESGCTKVVLLVDDIMKINAIGEKFSDYCRSTFCSLLDGRNPLYHLVIISTPSAEFILKEICPSGRPVVPIISLPLLTFKESYEILDSNIKLEFAKQEGIDHPRPDEEIRSYCLQQLADICGGHGRSIECVVKYSQSMFRTTLSLTDIISLAAAVVVGSFQSINVNLILKAVLLGESVGMGDMIGEKTCEWLVSRGVFVHSFTNCQRTFVPMSPELFLHAWVTNQNVNRKFSACLSTILDMRYKFSSNNFETLHSRWEQLIRFARSDKKYKMMPICEVYRIPLIDRHNYNRNPNCIENSTQCPVDAQSEVTMIKYKPNTRVKVALNTIHIPISPMNAGWDQLILYEAFPTGNHPTTQMEQRYVLPVFIENKWSLGDATTMLTLKTVEDVVKKCQHFLVTKFQYQNCQLIPQQNQEFKFGYSESPFVVIFFVRQIFDQNVLTRAPRNVMFCFEEDLHRLYGPTLGSFVKYLLPDEIQSVSPLAPPELTPSSTTSTPNTTTTSATSTPVSNPPTGEEDGEDGERDDAEQEQKKKKQKTKKPKKNNMKKAKKWIHQMKQGLMKW